MWRKDWVSKYIAIVPIVIVAIILAIYFFFRFAGKVNTRVATKGGKRTFWEEVLYAFHLLFHPFDGFWDLKHEKRGSVRGAFFWLAVTILAFTYNAIGRSYVFNPYGGYVSILYQVTGIVVPVLLWVSANWALTTLFEGEGSFKDVFIATSYSLTPLPLLMIPATLLTNVLTRSEGGIINILISLAWVWVGMLVVVGSMVTHDYTFAKNVLTSIGTIVGMCVIMFLALLFTGLITKIVGFITSIYTEISYRI
jgi:hypothetical protein